MSVNYEFWKREHSNPDMLPQISTETPSSSIIKFLQFLREQHLPTEGASVLSLGCGKGRNEIHMASAGLRVVGVDYIKAAVEEAKKRARNALGEGWTDKLTFVTGDVLDYLTSTESESFDYVADIVFTTDVEDFEKRKQIGEEACRALKGGGHLLFYALHTTDPVNRFQVASGEQGLVFLKENSKYEKLFDEGAAKQLYPALEMLKSEIIEKDRVYLGEIINGKLLYAVFRK